MRIVFFDLGRTLEYDGELLPGAVETLQTIQEMRDTLGAPPVLALISDHFMTKDPARIPLLRQDYYAELERLGIRSFFEPLAERVTLSTELGVRKPDERMFRTAIDRIAPGLGYAETMFTADTPEHVEAARRLGMTAYHLEVRGEPAGDVGSLPDLIPLVQRFVSTGPARG
jgi:FMN phosphatase YigB (HAD superfamily)